MGSGVGVEVGVEVGALPDEVGVVSGVVHGIDFGVDPPGQLPVLPAVDLVVDRYVDPGIRSHVHPGAQLVFRR